MIYEEQEYYDMMDVFWKVKNQESESESRRDGIVDWRPDFVRTVRFCFFLGRRNGGEAFEGTLEVERVAGDVGETPGGAGRGEGLLTEVEKTADAEAMTGKSAQTKASFGG